MSVVGSFFGESPRQRETQVACHPKSRVAAHVAFLRLTIHSPSRETSAHIDEVVLNRCPDTAPTVWAWLPCLVVHIPNYDPQALGGAGVTSLPLRLRGR